MSDAQGDWAGQGIVELRFQSPAGEFLVPLVEIGELSAR